MKRVLCILTLHRMMRGAYLRTCLCGEYGSIPSDKEQGSA